jgi:hypothetical protein
MYFPLLSPLARWEKGITLPSSSNSTVPVVYVPTWKMPLSFNKCLFEKNYPGQFPEKQKTIVPDSKVFTGKSRG